MITLASEMASLFLPAGFLLAGKNNICFHDVNFCCLLEIRKLAITVINLFISLQHIVNYPAGYFTVWILLYSGPRGEKN
jgi:hypothetical protein